MTRIRVAAGVLNQTPMDWSGNRANGGSLWHSLTSIHGRH